MSRRFLKAVPPIFKCGPMTIDWSNPLSRSLRICIPFHEGAGARFRELVTGIYGAPNGGSAVWDARTRYGYGQSVSNQSNRTALWAANAAWDFSMPPITVVSYGHYFSMPVTNSGICGLRTSDSSYRFRLIKPSTISNQELQFSVRNANDAPISGIPFVADRDFMIAASYDGASVRYFMNGKMSTVSYTQTPNSTGHPLVYGTVLGNTFNGIAAGMMVWSRALGFRELQELYAEPWAMMVPYPVRARRPLSDDQIATAQPLVFVMGG